MVKRNYWQESANLFGVNSDPTIVVKQVIEKTPFEDIVPQDLEFDATDFVSRVILLRSWIFWYSNRYSGEATISSNPYKDLHDITLTRVGMVHYRCWFIKFKSTVNLNELKN